MDLEQKLKTAKTIKIKRFFNPLTSQWKSFKYEESYYDKELILKSLIPIDENGNTIKGQSFGINTIEKDYISVTFNYAGIFIPMTIKSENLQFEIY